MSVRSFRPANRLTSPSARSPVRVGIIWAILILVALPSVALGAPATTNRAAPSISGPRQNSTSGCAVINYTSTADGFPLSYYECLPSGFVNSSSYPLAIFLHGINGSATTPQRGGYLTDFNASWVPIASAWGYILLVPNTRTGAGFYINSPYTGPQEQDIWDAIHSEESRHSISSLYLFGSSMGTMGTFLIAGHSPGTFRGIGAVLSFSDYFEEYDYLEVARGNDYTATLLAAIDGGALPNQSATALRMWLELSTPRFAPQNFSGVRMYIVHGGNDIESPNNPATWAYQQANDTLLNRTCLVAADVGEPANCSQPLTVLHALDPSQYDFRYVYEPNGTHTTDELNLTDMFAFWAGDAAPGIFWSSAYGSSPALPPSDPVNFATVPASCGSVTFAGRSYSYGDLTTLANGSYTVGAVPCAGYTLSAITAFGNASYDVATSTVNVTGSAVVVAHFAPTVVPPAPNVTFFANPSSCAPLTVNGSSVAYGATVSLRAGEYPLSAADCAAETFVNWTVTGSVETTAPFAAATELVVTGNGTVTAEYRSTTPPPPPAVFRITVGITPDPCNAGFSINNTAYPNDTTVSLPLGNYTISTQACPGFSFDSWNLTGALGLIDPNGLDVDGNGSVLAIMTPTFVVPGGGNGTGAGGFPGPILPTLVVVGVVVVVGAAAMYALRGRRPRPPTPDELATDSGRAPTEP